MQLKTLMTIALGLAVLGFAQPAPPDPDPPPTPVDYVPAPDSVFKTILAGDGFNVDTNKVIHYVRTTNTIYVIKPTKTVVTVWLTDDLTGENYAAVVHTTPRPVSFYKVDIKEYVESDEESR